MKHEWKGWSFKMRQYIAAVDEELYFEPVSVEARECASEETSTKDRAFQMITKLSDPVNGFDIWRRFLEEWEPAHGTERC